VLKAIVGVIDWKLPMQQALDLPNLIARGPSFYSEPDRFAPGVVDGLKAKAWSSAAMAARRARACTAS